MTEPLPPHGRLAGIDYGHVRIGIAVTDSQRKLASPYENYQRSGPDADARRFRRLVQEEDIVGFVVGLPVHGSGQESSKSIEAREFARWLAAVASRPVCLFDERYTTIEAEQILGAAQLTSKRRKQRRDMLAAQIMLAAFLESEDRGATDPGSLDD